MNKNVDILIFNECRGAHAHEYPQILVPLRDKMTIHADGEDFDVSSRDLCFIPAGTIHQCNYTGRLLAINMSDGLPDIRDCGILSYPMVIPMHGQVIQLVELIQTELKHNPESKSVRYLYSYLYSKLTENCAAPSIRYIGEHYDMPITVNQLAEMERYNVTYYNNWFKQQTGYSPSLYLRHIRIERAKELLSETELSVMEVAVMVGYSSNSTFTRAFHAITGMTPKVYRECPCFKQRLG